MLVMPSIVRAHTVNCRTRLSSIIESFLMHWTNQACVSFRRVYVTHRGKKSLSPERPDTNPISTYRQQFSFHAHSLRRRSAASSGRHSIPQPFHDGLRVWPKYNGGIGLSVHQMVEHAPRIGRHIQTPLPCLCRSECMKQLVRLLSQDG